MLSHASQVAAQAELSSQEVLEILTLVYDSILEVEKEVARAPSIRAKMDDRTITNREFENHLVDAARLVSDSLWRVTAEKNNVATALTWIAERITSSVGMIAPLRDARSHMFSVEQALKQLDSEWSKCSEKLFPAPDGYGGDLHRIEIRFVMGLFLDSRKSLKEVIVGLDKSIQNLEQYMLVEEESNE